ncbi:MAG: hypothetical protein ACKOW0_00795 [Schleiferiaceae bacterium]
MQIKARSPQHNSAGTIDMEIEHPVYGWIPFTASPDDTEPMGRDLYAQAVAGDLGPVAEYVAPPPMPTAVPKVVTRAQGKAALLQAGLWSPVLLYVNAIEDGTQRSLAEVAVNDTTHWERSSPFLNAAAQALGLSSEQMDQLFTTASQIQL